MIEYGKIGVLCFATLMDSFGYSLLLNVLPSLVDISDPVHFSGVERISAGSAYSLLLFTFVSGTTIFPLIMGRWSDSIGRRILILFSLLIVLITSLLQALTSSFWIIAVLRFLSGASGCLRPLAIAYIADMISEEKTRGVLITSLSLLSSFSVGFGPLMGAWMVGSDRSYPFIFMAGGSGACLILVYFFIPDLGERKGKVSSSPAYGGKPRDMSRVYMSVLILGFSTYFMSMMAAIAFPLTLKESFGLSALAGSACSVVDGPLIFASNYFFIRYLTSIPSACQSSVVASLVFCIIALVPFTVSLDADGSLLLFLVLKYSTSLAAPIVFSTLPQILINVCPHNVCGYFTGLLTFSHGAGRLTATALVGPLFSYNAEIPYNSVALVGLISSFLFLVLSRELHMTSTGRDTPLLADHCLSREPTAESIRFRDF